MNEMVAVRKEGSEGPVPHVWRATLSAIVDALVDGAPPSLPQVAFESLDTWECALESVRDYGEHLTTLPEEAWESSVCIWYGDYWNVLVDLYTEEEGRSDLVLQLRVHEEGEGYRYEVDMVYVP